LAYGCSCLFSCRWVHHRHVPFSDAQPGQSFAGRHTFMAPLRDHPLSGCAFGLGMSPYYIKPIVGSGTAPILLISRLFRHRGTAARSSELYAAPPTATSC
jgi:hypothetical protein